MILRHGHDLMAIGSPNHMINHYYLLFSKNVFNGHLIIIGMYYELNDAVSIPTSSANLSRCDLSHVPMLRHKTLFAFVGRQCVSIVSIVLGMPGGRGFILQITNCSSWVFVTRYSNCGVSSWLCSMADIACSARR